MKICPRCDQPVPDVASICPHCGTEIRESEDDNLRRRQIAAPRRADLAYSSFAQLTLEIWAFLTLLGMFIALIIAAVSVFQSEWLRVLFGLISAWGNFALYALLRRVADWNDN